MHCFVRFTQESSFFFLIHKDNFVFQAGDVAFRDSSITDITRKQKNVINIKKKKAKLKMYIF